MAKKDNLHPILAKIKTDAKHLQILAKEKGEQLIYGHALDQASKRHGYEDWNTACGSVKNTALKSATPSITYMDAVSYETLEKACEQMRSLGLTTYTSKQSLSDFSWGGGTSYVYTLLKSMSDEEVVQRFKGASMRDRSFFLSEMQRRGIKSIVFDLEGDVTEEELTKVMGLFSDLDDDSISADYSHIEAMLKEETCFQQKAVNLDPMPFSLKSDIPLLKKKTLKPYQELNRKQLNKNRY